MAELQNDLGAGDGAGEEPVADELVAQEETQPGQQPAQPQPTRRDLTEDPQFREFQRKNDQRIASLQQQLAAAQARADEQALAGMDDFEKMEFQLQRERRDREQERMFYQTQMAEQQTQMAEQAKREGLAAIAQQHGVPMNVLDDRSPEAAEASALRYKLAQLQTRQADSQAQETAERNRVDVGSGPPQGADARLRARVNQLRKSGAPATEIYKQILRGAA